MVKTLVWDVHGDRSMAERLAHAARLVSNGLSAPVVAFLILAWAFALRHPVQRWFVSLVVVPFAVIWALAFSYELRNLALAVPFAGAAAGCGFVQMIHGAEGLGRRFGVNPWARIPNVLPWTVAVSHRLAGLTRVVSVPCAVLRLRLSLVVVLLLGPVVLVAATIRSDDLAKRQRELQRSAGVPDTNRQLYEHLQCQGIEGYVATDYLCMRWLPDLNRHYLACPTDGLATFQTVYERADVRYALVHKAHTAPEVRRYLEQQGGPEASRLLFDSKYYQCYCKTRDR